MDRELIYSWYECYKDGIYRFALSVLKDPHLAEDVLQETFLKLMTGRYTHLEGKEQAWLFRVARNQCYDILRKRKREQSEPERCQGETENYAYIEMTVCLERRDQEIVTLKVLSGMTYREIGRIVGLTAHACQKRYERALRKLREQEE